VPHVSAGLSVPTHDAWHALPPQIIFAPWHAWIPAPHCRSQGPACEHFTVVF
jgi:hypothetical protein